MARQGTNKVFGGTPAKRYTDPSQSNLPNEYGLYPWSSFVATVVEVVDGAVVPYTDSASSLQALLFTSDIPAKIVYYGSNIGGPPQYGPGYNELSAFVSKTKGVFAGATITAFGEVVKGYAGAAYDVYVSGFPIAAQTAVGEFYFIDCTANSPNICSPIGNSRVGELNFGTPVGKGSTPILIKYDQYTQAIKDNNNIIEQAGYSYIVVGLARAA
jgi:hypothetical protein